MGNFNKFYDKMTKVYAFAKKSERTKLSEIKWKIQS